MLHLIKQNSEICHTAKYRYYANQSSYKLSLRYNLGSDGESRYA